MEMITREEIIKAIKKLGEKPKERPSIEEMEKNVELCKKPIKISWEDVRMIYPQKWDFEDVDFKKERAYKEDKQC